MGNNTEESKKKNVRIFMTYIFTLVYVLITTASVSDVQLILNDLVTLPIINVKVGTTLFFLIAPLFLIAIYIFFQLHYLHLKSHNSEVAQYPNWPLFEFTKLLIAGNENHLLKKIQSALSNIVIWDLLPLTLIVMLFRNLVTHEILRILYLTLLSLIGIGFTFFIWKLNSAQDITKIKQRFLITLSTNTFLYVVYIFCIQRLLKSDFSVKIYKDSILLIIFIMFLVFSPWLSYILQKFFIKITRVGSVSFNFLLTLLLVPFLSIHYLILTPYGNGRNLDLSYQIITYSNSQQHYGVYTVDLRNKNLIAANMISSVLHKADMRHVDLRKAALFSAKLDSSNLSDADLSNSILLNTNLRYADLSNAKFNNADLRGVIFRSANLSNADFTNANLQGANLEDAILDSTNFKNANLRDVKLQSESFKNVKPLIGTKLDTNIRDDIQKWWPFLVNQK
jgi:hypothetical protein